MAETTDQRDEETGLRWLSIEDEKIGDELKTFLRGLESGKIVITEGGQALGLLIRFDSDEDLEDFLFEHSPDFIRQIAAARASIAAGKGVPLEEVDKYL
ncbi:MAG: prevent-host-death protein [Acidobacteria bacterium]|nr:prevent-host-death protein [Acidobacteriota bacterium]MCI0659443.1 prevent-host-death protein [Acidobacteriota bacterium]